MGVLQLQADAINLRDRSKTNRQRAASELQKAEQYRMNNDPDKAQQHQDIADKLNQEAALFDGYALERDHEAAKLEQQIDQVKHDLANIEQELELKRRELHDLEGRSAFSLF